MFCPKCKTKNLDDAVRCVKCGVELFPGSDKPLVGPPESSAKALLSFLLGILGIACLWILAGIPAVLLGLLARRDIQRSGGRLGGDGLALAGIVLGAVGCLISLPVIGTVIALPGIRTTQQRNRNSRARYDMQALQTAIESYFVDHSSYPAFAIGEKSHNAFLGAGHPAFALPTFALVQIEGPYGIRIASLTTPVAYVPTIPRDGAAPAPKADDGQRPGYLYWAVAPNRADTASLYGKDSKVSGQGWILVSTGPDGDYDLAGEWDAYDPSVTQPSSQLIGGTNKKGSALTYDPTNGLMSDGDIWLVKK